MFIQLRQTKILNGSLAIGFVLFLIMSSCKTIQPYADKADKLLQSKRYKACLSERDQLCNDNQELKKDTVKLGQQLRKLSEECGDLDDKYKTLSISSGMQLVKMNEDLNSKSLELDKKEKILQEREQKLKEMQNIINKQDSLVNHLNTIVKNALLGFNSDELTVEMKNGKVYISMSDRLLFKSGSADVEVKGNEALKNVAEVLNKNTDVDILIEGHTDNVPIKTLTYNDNWDLSAARATSVVRLLTVGYRVDPKRLTASGKGEFCPVASNLTTEGKAKNRRTEIILSPKLDELFKILENHQH